MLRLFSSRSTTFRWPVAVWHNLLDMAIVNAWICYKEASKVNIPRKQFILNLVKQLVGAVSPPCTDLEITFSVATKRKCQVVMWKIKTTIQCQKCKIMICGKHCDSEISKISLTVCKQCVD